MHSYPSVQACAMNTQNNRLKETRPNLLSTPNMVWLRNKKNSFQIRTLNRRSGPQVIKLFHAQLN